MNLNKLKDRELLTHTKLLAQKERSNLTQILFHLSEVERRRLYSDLGYQSLFYYAVGELKYSEGQAGRRLQAMRLMKEFPEIAAKVESGCLNLSNISQAQSYFRKVKVSAQEKRQVLASLENRSSREGQVELLKLQPVGALPRERERRLTESHSEVSFVVSDELKEKLETVRSLLGSRGALMSFAELISEMAGLSAEALQDKRFGLKRSVAPAQEFAA